MFNDEYDDEEEDMLSWQSWLIIAAMAFTAAIAVSFGW